jgi:hypothetical protein
MNAAGAAPTARVVSFVFELVVALNSPLTAGELVAGSIMPYWFDHADCQRSPRSICLIAEARGFRDSMKNSWTTGLTIRPHAAAPHCCEAIDPVAQEMPRLMSSSAIPIANGAPFDKSAQDMPNYLSVISRSLSNIVCLRMLPSRS